MSLAGEFPAQRPSNAENASISWRHHVSHASEATLGTPKRKRHVFTYNDYYINQPNKCTDNNLCGTLLMPLILNLLVLEPEYSGKRYANVAAVMHLAIDLTCYIAYSDKILIGIKLVESFKFFISNEQMQNERQKWTTSPSCTLVMIIVTNHWICDGCVRAWIVYHQYIKIVKVLFWPCDKMQE